MAKRQQPDPSSSVGVAGPRRQTRGPLGPGIPELSIFAALAGDELAATPGDMTHKGRKIGILVTDDPSCEGRFAHDAIEMVGERHPRVALLSACMAAKALPHEDRIITVAGSAELVNAALDDSWRVVIRCAADAPPPRCLTDWRTSRPKGSDATSLTRD